MNELFIDELKKNLDDNNGKISYPFIESYLNHKDTKVSHAKITPSTRVCVITLPTGHDIVGYAQVLDSKNDVELIGQEIAYNNAKENIWAAFGSIAKVLR